MDVFFGTERSNPETWSNLSCVLIKNYTATDTFEILLLIHTNIDTIEGT